MSKRSKFAIWIEKDRISFRLYGAKRGVSVKGMNRDKRYWAAALVERGGRRLTRLRRLQATSTNPMCVAEWRGWLAFGDGGHLDLARTASNLTAARRTFVSTIKGGKA